MLRAEQVPPLGEAKMLFDQASTALQSRPSAADWWESSKAAASAPPTTTRPAATPDRQHPAAVIPSPIASSIAALRRGVGIALCAGLVGIVAASTAAQAAVRLPTTTALVALGLMAVIVAGIRLDRRRDGHYGLAAALLSAVPTWIVLPQLEAIGVLLSAPAALGITLTLSSLLPAFAFSYILAPAPPKSMRRPYVRHQAAGAATLLILVVLQAKVAGAFGLRDYTTVASLRAAATIEHVKKGFNDIAAFRPPEYAATVDWAAEILQRIKVPDDTLSQQSSSDQALTRVKYVQGRLNRLGYNAGPVDGVLGPQTRGAIWRFQRAAGLPATGNIDAQLVHMLQE